MSADLPDSSPSRRVRDRRVLSLDDPEVAQVRRRRQGHWLTWSRPTADDPRQALTGRALTLVTDTPPRYFWTDEHGLTHRSGTSGGAQEVVEGSASDGLDQGRPVRIVVPAKTPEQRQLAAKMAVLLEAGAPEQALAWVQTHGRRVPLYFAPTDPESYDLGRDGVFSNWFWWLAQEMVPGRFLQALARGAWPAYEANNLALAEFAAQEAITPKPLSGSELGGEVHIHDTQNGLVGSYLADLRPDVTTASFLHSSMFRRRYLRDLLKHHPAIASPELRTLLAGLARSDALVLQTPADEKRMRGVLRELGIKAPQLGNALVAADPGKILDEFFSSAVQGKRKKSGMLHKVWDEIGDRWLVVVDGRGEPYKNIPLAIEALMALFERGEVGGGLDPAKTALVVISGPTREKIPAYRAYWSDLVDCIEHANRRFKYAPDAPDRPFILAQNVDRARLLSYMSRANVHITPARLDGCNLMIFEAALVNLQKFVQIVSSTVGAWTQLGPLERDGAQPVAYDIDPPDVARDYNGQTHRFDMPSSMVSQAAGAVMRAHATSEADRGRMAEAMYVVALFHRSVRFFDSMVRLGSLGHARRVSPEQPAHVTTQAQFGRDRAGAATGLPTSRPVASRAAAGRT